MELDEADQRAVLSRVAEEAKGRGLLVAPIGSVYFLVEGERTLRTKDVDAVIHAGSGDLATLAEVEALGRALGEIETSEDRALVKVRIRDGELRFEIDLLRGRRTGKAGFLPRELLRAAAGQARREGNVLWYPLELVLILKAEAAVDRARRAEKADRFAAENRRRAEAFRQDVFRQVQHASLHGKLQEEVLKEGLRYVKSNRRTDVATLLEAASGGKLKLS